MEIGDLVIHARRPCYLRGLDPMSVSGRRAELEDAATGERFFAPAEEVTAHPDTRAHAGGDEV